MCVAKSKEKGCWQEERLDPSSLSDLRAAAHFIWKSMRLNAVNCQTSDFGSYCFTQKQWNPMGVWRWHWHGRKKRKKEGVGGNKWVSRVKLYNWEMLNVNIGMVIYVAKCVNEAVKTQRGKGTGSLGSLEGKLSSCLQPRLEKLQDKKGFPLHSGQLCSCFCAAQVFRVRGGKKRKPCCKLWNLKNVHVQAVLFFATWKFAF